jgi:hypothetical protein
MRAFLSSTFVDLAEYRRVAAEALERLGQQVGRMEVFGARASEATEACLEEVEAADIFIGIYAHRYGFTPDPSGISITEQEFNHALEHLKPIFCFVVDDEFPWPPKMIEGEPGKGRLLAFKERIGRTRVRDSFTTPENLGLRIATSVGRYISVVGSARENSHSLSPPLALASVAGAAVAQTVATVFVDLMRLLYVVSSDAARQANERRYDSFVGMAERHLEDLRGTLAQFATALDSTAHHRSVAIQRRLSCHVD